MPLFYYFTVQFHLLFGEGGVKFPLLNFGFQSFELTMQDSHPRLYSSKKFIICVFLIYSGSLQRMSTALFQLV